MSQDKIEEEIKNISHAVANTKDIPPEARDIISGLITLVGIALDNQARQADALEHIANNLRPHRD